MPKFIGRIGFVEDDVQTAPGIHESVLVARKYRGDVLRTSYSNARSSTINNEFQVNATISVVADHKLVKNVGSIVWVEYLGAKWRATTVDFSEPPRLKIVLGGLYTEEEENYEDTTSD